MPCLDPLQGLADMGERGLLMARGPLKVVGGTGSGVTDDRRDVRADVGGLGRALRARGEARGPGTKMWEAEKTLTQKTQSNGRVVSAQLTAYGC
jgi:hypothetical protein